MSGPVSAGMDPARLRHVAERLRANAVRIDEVYDRGRGQLGVLVDVWEGPDLEAFQGRWDEAGPQVRETARLMRAAVEDLFAQADAQVEASDGEGRGGRSFGLPDFDLPDFDLPEVDPSGWDWPDVDWPELDVSMELPTSWDDVLEILEAIGDWWDDIPWWGQLLIGLAVVVVVVVIALLIGVTWPFWVLVGGVVAVVGAIMTILDVLDELAEIFRDPRAAWEEFINDPLAFLDNLIWILIGAIPFGIGPLLKRFRKPIREFFEEKAPWFKKKWDDITRKFNEWDKKARRRWNLGAKELDDPPPNNFPSDKKVQKKYSAHAKDFGLTDDQGNPLPWNKANGDKFRQAVDDHINDPATKHYDGYYRGDPAILDYNPETGLVVVRSPSGDFISGWKASAQQAENIVKRGSLQ